MIGPMTDMTGKTVVITGANQGIGKASAVALGAMGARLVLVCRNEEKARAAIVDIEKAGAKDVSLIVGDMASQKEIRRVASEIQKKVDKLDVLLNNAGVLVPQRRTTVDGIEETFAINHLGYFLLTKLLRDLLEKSGNSRIVNVSSEAHRRGKMNFDDLQFERTSYSAMAAYSQSKLANILFTKELARKLAGTKVTANCLHPGVIASGFGHTYGGLFSFILTLGRPFLASTEDGAKTQVHLCSSPDVEGITGEYWDKCKIARPTRAAQNEGDAKRLWELSEDLVAKSATTTTSTSTTTSTTT